MRYREISLDELEELEQEIHGHNEEMQEGLNYSKIELYDAMHAHLTVLAAQDADYQNYYTYIQQKLINYLMCYSGKLASADVNQRYAAEKALEKVLQYDASNPLASYRLACLLQQQNQHAKALVLLQKALDNQPDYIQSAYKLNAEQIKRALLFMASSSLQLASRAYVASSGIEAGPAEAEAGFSSIFSELQKSTSELRNTAYRSVSADAELFCSLEQCKEAIAEDPKDTIILFFNTEGPELIYNGITEKLASDHAYLLRYLLLDSCEACPMTPLDVKEFFLDTHVITGVTKPTLTKAAEGLIQVLQEIEIPSAVRQTEIQNQPAYYFDGSSKFLVLGRIDEELNLK